MGAAFVELKGREMAMGGDTPRFGRRAWCLGVVTAVIVVASSTLALVPAAQAVTSKVSSNAIPSGLGLAVDGAIPLAIGNGCTTVATGTRAALASVAVTAVGGTHTSNITIGAAKWRIRPAQKFSTVQWVSLQGGGFTACFSLNDLKSESLQLLANTVIPTESLPGGLADISARIPLATTGTTSGQWIVPPDTAPSSVGGLILEVSSDTSDVVQLVCGGATLNIVVGPNVPASTVIVPQGTPSWSDQSGVAPDALMLGFITDQSDGVTGGSVINVLSSPLSSSGSNQSLAGRDGLPAVNAEVPMTSVLATIKGREPAVEDSLAAGRRTPSGATARVASESFLRVASDGGLHFAGTAHLQVLAWLGGDVIYGPNSENLALKGSPTLDATPTSSTLQFSGVQSFPLGSTLILPASKYAPEGLIAIVDLVTAGTKSTTVEYSVGGLLDAFSELSLVAQIPAAAPDETVAEAVGARRINRMATLNTTASLGFTSSKGFQLGASVSGDVSFHFDPSVTLAVTVGTGWLGLPSNASVRFAVDATSSVTATLTAQAGVSEQGTFTLAHLTLTPFDLGPVVIVPELESTLAVGANVTAAVSLSGTVSEHAHVGMTISASVSRGFSTYGDSTNGFSTPTFSGSSLESSITGQATATLSFQFDLLAYGIVGPDVQASARLALNVDPPAWQVTAQGDFGIGLNLDGLDIPLLTKLLSLLGVSTNPTWTIGHLGPYTIASGTGSSGGGSTGGPVSETAAAAVQVKDRQREPLGAAEIVAAPQRQPLQAP